MSRRFICALLGLATLAACADRDPLSPAGEPRAQVSLTERAALEVKFRAPFAVRPGEGGLVSASGAGLQGVMALLDPAAGVRTSPLFSSQGLAIDAVAGAGAALQGEAAPDLASWYRVELPAAADVERFLAELRARPEVEHAYRAPDPAPPPGLAALFASPDFTGQQGYLRAAPEGSDAAWARTLPGGDGTGVMVVDLEYDWHLSHEDLALAPTAQIGTGSRYTGFGSNHGTAVLGELAGRANGFGVTGGVPGADIRVIPPIYYGGSYVPANAIAEAAAVMTPGDVLLIEQQATGPTGKYVPLEVIQSVFDATRAATLAGRVVVSAAGNGGQNLDAPEMSGKFDRNLRDSGAIIVGAGSSFRTRLYFSCYGSRVDVQGWGQGVTTTGYGSLFGSGLNNYYTSTFSGTSSASPIVAAAAAAVQGRLKARGLSVLGPVQLRELLRATGTPQTGDLTQPIGPLPNLRVAFGELSAPGAPATVAAAMLSATRVRVSWPAALDSVTHFQVARRALSADSIAWVDVASPSGAVRRFDDAGLSSGSTYVHRVRACNAEACSDWTYGPAVALVPPAAPAGMTGTAVSGTRLRLTWADSIATETGFRLERRRRLDDGTWSPFQQIAAPTANTTVYADTGLVSGGAYRYRVAACNPAGCSAWATGAPVVMPSTPNLPMPVHATLQSNTSIRVTWEDNSGNETGFEVIRRAHGADGTWGPWVPRGAAPPNSYWFADSAAIGAYQYRVRACSGPLCSSYVTSTTIVMPVPPATPTGLAGVALTPNTMQLTWTDASSSETWFWVSERMWNADTGWLPWRPIARLPANSTTFVVEGPTPAHTYEYRVNACHDVVCSPWTSGVRLRRPAS